MAAIPPWDKREIAADSKPSSLQAPVAEAEPSVNGTAPVNGTSVNAEDRFFGM